MSKGKIIVGIIAACIVWGVCCTLYQCASDGMFESGVKMSLWRGNTEEAVQKMHELFIERYDADTFYVGNKYGVLVEKIATECIEQDDRNSAELLYEEYRRAMSDHGRRELESYLRGELLQEPTEEVEEQKEEQQHAGRRRRRNQN